MDLLTLHNHCVSSSLDFLKLWFDSKSCLPISGFSGGHCITVTVMKKFKRYQNKHCLRRN